MLSKERHQTATGPVWNRVPDEVKRKVVDFAFQETELSPRELAVTFTDQERYFVSESTVYRVLKAHDLITSPSFIVIKAVSEFKDKTTAVNQLPLSSPQAATAGQRADRLHIPEGSGLRLVLSQHDLLAGRRLHVNTVRPGRLQPVHHLVETLHQYEGRGCERHPRPGARGVGL